MVHGRGVNTPRSGGCAAQRGGKGKSKIYLLEQKKPLPITDPHYRPFQLEEMYNKGYRLNGTVSDDYGFVRIAFKTIKASDAIANGGRVLSMSDEEEE